VKSQNPSENSCQTTGCGPAQNQELIEQGWEQRFVGDERMVRESTEMYSDMGYEVKILPLDTTNVQGDCMGCLALLKKFQVVYTRQKKSPS